VADLEQVVAKFEADVSGFVAGMRKAESASDQSTKKIEQRWQGVGNTLRGVGEALAGAFAAEKLREIGARFVDAFDEAAQGQARLRAAISAAGGSVDQEIARATALAETIQRATVVQDDEVVAILARARAMGLSEQASGRAAVNAVALSRAQGISAETAIRMTAALEQGSTAMIMRQLPALRGIKDESARLAKTQELLTGMFAGAEAEARAGLGPYRQLQNEVNDLEEGFGNLIAGGLIPVVQHARAVVKVMQETSPETKKFALAIGGLAVGVPAAALALSGVVRITAAVAASLSALRVATVGVASGIARGVAAIAAAFASIPVLVATAVAGTVVAAVVFRKTLVGMVDGIGEVLHRQFVNEVERPLLQGINDLVDGLPDSALFRAVRESMKVEVPPEVPEAGKTFANVWKNAGEQAAADMEEMKARLQAEMTELANSIPGPVKDIGKVFASVFSGEMAPAAEDFWARIQKIVAEMDGKGGIGAAVGRDVEQAKEKFKELRDQFGSPLGKFTARLDELDKLEKTLAPIKAKLGEASAAGKEFNDTFNRARAALVVQYGEDVDKSLGGILTKLDDLRKATRTPLEQVKFDVGELDSQENSLKLLDQFKDRGAELDAVFDRARKQVGGLDQDYKQLLAQTRTPVEKLQFDLSNLDEMKKAYEAAGYAGAELDQAISRQQQNVRDEFSKTKDVAHDLGLTFTSAFEDAVVEGKKFSEVLQGIEKDLIRLALRRLVTEPALNALEGVNWTGLVGSVVGAFVGGGAAGTVAAGEAAAVSHAKGGVFDAGRALPFARGEAFFGGRTLPFAAGGTIINRPTTFPMRGDQIGLMGEAGPEAILPLQRGPDGSLGVRAVGGRRPSDGLEARLEQVSDRFAATIERVFARIRPGRATLRESSSSITTSYTDRFVTTIERLISPRISEVLRPAPAEKRVPIVVESPIARAVERAITARPDTAAGAPRDPFAPRPIGFPKLARREDDLGRFRTPVPVAADRFPVAAAPRMSDYGARRSMRDGGTGASGPRVEVNVFAPPGSQVRQERKQKGPDMEQLNIMVDQAVGQLMERPGSKTHRALRRTFGATPQTTNR
jgi:hypothetical protein